MLILYFASCHDVFSQSVVSSPPSPLQNIESILEVDSVDDNDAQGVADKVRETMLKTGVKIEDFWEREMKGDPEVVEWFPDLEKSNDETDAAVVSSFELTLVKVDENISKLIVYARKINLDLIDRAVFERFAKMINFNSFGLDKGDDMTDGNVLDLSKSRGETKVEDMSFYDQQMVIVDEKVSELLVYARKISLDFVDPAIVERFATMINSSFVSPLEGETEGEEETRMKFNEQMMQKVDKRVDYLLIEIAHEVAREFDLDPSVVVERVVARAVSYRSIRTGDRSVNKVHPMAEELDSTLIDNTNSLPVSTNKATFNFTSETDNSVLSPANAGRKLAVITVPT